MLSSLRSALNTYKSKGFDDLVVRSIEHFERKLYPKIISYDPIDRICYNKSMDLLDKRKEKEETINDILYTTGYKVFDRNALAGQDWEDGKGILPGWGSFPGRYSGYGLYKSIEMYQERTAIAKFAQAVKEENPKKVLEIGSANGGTFYLWSRYLSGAKLLISIDKKYPGRRKEFFRNFNRGKNIICVEADIVNSENIIRDKIGDINIDFMYIDLPHSYKLFKKAFEKYKPMLDNNAIVGMHDISQPWSDVKELWNEMKNRYKTKEYGRGPIKNGLISL